MNNSPLWEHMKRTADRQEVTLNTVTTILNRIENLDQSLEGLGQVLSKLAEITAKSDRLMDLIEKIDIQRLENTLKQLDNKIPNIEPLLGRVGIVVELVERLACEMGIVVTGSLK